MYTDWIYCAYVARAHGVHGTLRIIPESLDYPLPEKESFLELRTTTHAPRIQRYKVREARLTHDAWLVDLHEITSRNDAELWRSASVFIAAETLKSFETDDNAYTYELHGATVVDSITQAHLGVIARVLDNKSQALLEIETPEGDVFLFPLVEATFDHYERDSNTLFVRMPEGLREAMRT